MLKAIGYLLLAAIILFLLLLLVINFWPGQPTRPIVAYQNIIVFGDSLSDSAPTRWVDNRQQGNNYWAPPQGVSSYRGAPITSDINVRDTDRYTWLNYLLTYHAFALGGDQLLIKRTLGEQQLHVDNSVYSYNVSYATASAQTGNNYIDDKHADPVPVIDCPENRIFANEQYSCVPGLLKQVHMYLADAGDTINPQTLFIIWAGGNDIYQNIVKLTTSNSDNQDATKLSSPIGNTTQAVKLLIDKGAIAKHIYVLDLPNFSLVPAVVSLVNNNVDNTFLRSLSLKAISAFSRWYNIWLKTRLVLSTGWSFSPANFFSISDLLMAIKDNKDDIREQLGIDKPLAQTCTDAKQMPLCEGFFFYNDMHPTTKVHAYIGKRLQDYILNNNENEALVQP